MPPKREDANPRVFQFGVKANHWHGLRLAVCIRDREPPWLVGRVGSLGLDLAASMISRENPLGVGEALVKTGELTAFCRMPPAVCPMSSILVVTQPTFGRGDRLLEGLERPQSSPDRRGPPLAIVSAPWSAPRRRGLVGLLAHDAPPGEHF